MERRVQEYRCREGFRSRDGEKGRGVWMKRRVQE